MSELPRRNSESSREAMSALADGQVDAAAATDLWAQDVQAREAWHTYHLIGDVLRSEDLASSTRHDGDFLARLRERLADEPPILAPKPAIVAALTTSPRRRWIAPAAVAAGFVAVVGVLVMTRTVAPVADGAPVLAAAPASSPLMAGAVVAGEPQLQLVDGKLIRDARLDSYLRAHRGGTAALPGSAIGRFETVVLER